MMRLNYVRIKLCSDSGGLLLSTSFHIAFVIVLVVWIISGNKRKNKKILYDLGAVSNTN